MRGALVRRSARSQHSLAPVGSCRSLLTASYHYNLSSSRGLNLTSIGDAPTTQLPRSQPLRAGHKAEFSTQPVVQNKTDPWNRRGSRKTEREKAAVGKAAKGTERAGYKMRTPMKTATPKRAELSESELEYGTRKLLTTLKLPTIEAVPYMSRQLLEEPKSEVAKAIQGSGFAETRVRLGAGFWRCRLTYTRKDKKMGKLEVYGDGLTKQRAEHASYIHLISKLYELGRIEELIILKTDKYDSKLYSKEKDAMIDIYEYCAKWMCIPQINAKTLKNHRGRPIYEVQITLPEQDIEVKGVALSQAHADIAAALKFKQEAERYQAKQGTASLQVKDHSSLNVANAPHFFEFYRQVHPGARVEVIQEDVGKDRREAHVQINDKPIGTPITIVGKQRAENLAYLVAAVVLSKENSPNFLQDFFAALKAGNGNILRQLQPMNFAVEDTGVMLMRDTLARARQGGLTDQYEELQGEELDPTLKEGPTRQLKHDPSTVTIRNETLMTKRRRYLENPGLQELRSVRNSLPMLQHLEQVVRLINQNIYSIVIGATGSGKTTQVPQILLDKAIEEGKGGECNIVCTQPRRIAATSVARRVAAERAESLQDTVGYHVRFDAARARKPGSINYCTTGILLQQLQMDPNGVLDNLSHVIIDEVHERDQISDFLMVILRQVMAERIANGKSVPRVVLMSATLDSSLFAPYFQNTNTEGLKIDAPVLSVPGRTFPVVERYLENTLHVLEKEYGSGFVKQIQDDKDSGPYLENERKFAQESPFADGTESTSLPGSKEESIIDWKKKPNNQIDDDKNDTSTEDSIVPIRLAAATVAHIARTTDEGAILVFLPGLDEIVKVDTELRTAGLLNVNFNDESKYKMFMLHSSMNQSQSDVFEKLPSGRRKIILSTNIAETSVTIPDVQYVVDSGKLRELQYDQKRRITKLQCTWVSKSNAKQRAGRAGRVQNGNYYALYTRSRYESLRPVGLPELLRVDLQDICLAVVAQKWPTPVRDFLADAIEPPPSQAVDEAMRTLVKMEALTEEEKLTPLGRLLSSLPIDPSLGKMIVLGVIFRCLDPVLILGAAAGGTRSLFTNPLDRKNEATETRKRFNADNSSDHIATLNAFREIRTVRQRRGHQAAYDYCRNNFLHMGAFTTIENTAQQIEQVLVEARLIPAVPPGMRENFQLGDPSLNENSNKPNIIKALVLAGLYPNLGVRVNPNYITWRTASEKAVLMHPGSVNAESLGRRKQESPSRRGNDSQFAVYDALARSNDGNSLFMRNSSLVSPLTISLFGGRLALDNGSSRVLRSDKWLPFYMLSDDRRAAQTLIEFRKALDRMLVGTYRDLSKRQLLAEDPVRAIFADGVVDVFGLDLHSAAAGRAYGTASTSYDAGRKEGDAWEMVKARLMRDDDEDVTQGTGRAPGRGSWARKDSGDLTLGMLDWAAKWEHKAKERAAKGDSKVRQRWA